MSDTETTAPEEKKEHKSGLLPYVIFLLVIAVLVIVYFLVIADREEVQEGLTLEEKLEIMRNVAANADPITLTEAEKEQAMGANRAVVTLTPEEKLEILERLNNDS